MQPRIRIVALSLIVVLCFNCLAGNPQSGSYSNTPVTLQDYLRLAALNNAGLKAEFEQWKAALEQIPQAKALPDPRFTYGYFIEEVETRVGPQRHMFDIMQTFPWFGTIEARTDQATATAKAAYKRYNAKKLQLFQQVKHAFYEYDYLAKAIRITEQNLELMIHFEEVARTRYATATTTHPDVIHAQIELAILEDRLKSLQELKPSITARLNSILNRSISSDLPWPESPKYQFVSVEFRELQAVIQRNNPNLQAVAYEIEAARNGEKLAKKNSYPDIGIGLSYIDTAHALASGVDDSGKDPFIAMISLNLPIWTDSYKAARRQATAHVRQKVQEKVQMENTLYARGQELLYELYDGDRKIRLYGDVVIPKVKEMLTVSEAAYKAGKIDFLSLIDAQRMLLKYELYRERLTSENAQRLAELESLAGTDMYGIATSRAASN